MKRPNILLLSGGIKGKFPLFLFFVLFSSCKGGDDTSEPYPNVVTEFAMIKTNDSGMLAELTTDDERTYTISNPQDGYDKNVMYRAVCGYVPDGQTATLYHATGAYLLHDSTKLSYEPDAIKVVSVWKSGRYINMQLSPLTQGGIQYWGYRIDNVHDRTAHITLHHCQNHDPLSYMQTVYASLPMDSLKTISAGDSIALHIKTFNGEQVWTFQKP